MTAPPGGPYGQDPYGTNPYGQGQYPGGQPPAGGYPYPPPGGPYANPQGPANPYAGGAYPPPQQFPQPGRQVPPGWPGGPYPPGPPPRGPRSKAPWLILGGIAVLGVIVLVVILIIGLIGGNKSTKASPSATSVAPTSQPNNSDQTATGCTPNVSAGEKPVGGGPISAGKLSFPPTAAPGWAPFTDDQTPNLISAVGVGQEVPGANQWMMQAEVAVTNFVTSMDVATQASKLMDCVVNGPGYANASPTAGPKKTSSIKVDGVKAARVDADIAIADKSRNVKGDSLTIIAVATQPVTVFVGASPIGDAGSAGIINGVIAALKVGQ